MDVEYGVMEFDIHGTFSKNDDNIFNIYFSDRRDKVDVSMASENGEFVVHALGDEKILSFITIQKKIIGNNVGEGILGYVYFEDTDSLMVFLDEEPVKLLDLKDLGKIKSDDDFGSNFMFLSDTQGKLKTIVIENASKIVCCKYK